jgi:hypothetical protein
MGKFNIKTPHTVAGEGARAMLAAMWNHDIRQGLGGYYITGEDLTKVRTILGADAEEALKDAGFEQHPHHPRRYWTGPRAPSGDEARIQFHPPFSLFRAIAGMYSSDLAA